MGNGEADWRSHIPDTPLLVAGLVGGPLSIGSLTPFRNCLALASQDNTSSFATLVRRVLGGGVGFAYKGFFAPIPASVIQFTAVGPLYHIFASVSNPTIAVTASAAVETVVVFGSEGRNVMMAFNQSVTPEKQVALRSIVKPWGPGVLALFGRNMVANSGIRVLSDPLTNVVRRSSDTVGLSLGSGVCKVAGDFFSSMVCGAISMPFNQTFYFCQSSKELQETKSFSVRQSLIVKFLRSQYLTESGGISRMLVRDMTIRATYIGFLFSIFAGVERTSIALLS